MLRGFLRREYASQPLLNKVYLLWASAGLPGLLNEKERTALVAELTSKQQPDGGWSLSDMGTWKRIDDTPEETKSDGLATGLTVLALEQSGVAKAPVKRRAGLAEAESEPRSGELVCLVAEQEARSCDGYWPLYERCRHWIRGAGIGEQSLRVCDAAGRRKTFPHIKPDSFCLVDLQKARTKAIPQGLKPVLFAIVYGPAKAVP